MILPLYLVFINIILMPLKYKYIAPTKYLQGQGHLTSGQGHRNKTAAQTVSFFLIFKVIHPQSICCDIGINIITMPLQYKNIASTKCLQGQEGKCHLNSNLFLVLK